MPCHLCMFDMQKYQNESLAALAKALSLIYHLLPAQGVTWAEVMWCRLALH